MRSASRPTAPRKPSTPLTDQYFDQLFHFNPSNGTAVGFHQYDTQLEDYSAASIAAQVAALHAYDKKLAALDPHRPRPTRGRRPAHS